VHRLFTIAAGLEVHCFCFCFLTQEGGYVYQLTFPAALLDARARRDPLKAWRETRSCVAIIRVGGKNYSNKLN